MLIRIYGKTNKTGLKCLNGQTAITHRSCIYAATSTKFIVHKASKYHSTSDRQAIMTFI